MSAIFEIKHDDVLYAIVIPFDYKIEGMQFITPDELSQQLAYMQYRPGKTINAHTHNPVPRDVAYTRETLFIRKGKLRVDFYTDAGVYIESYMLQGGDVILLVNGGHGFEVVEPIEMIEVKQGPYAGKEDKTLIKNPISADQAIIKTRS